MTNKIFDLINKEEKRQEETLMMIPSENYASKNVLRAVGSVLQNKYAEGYPHRRYYQGNKYIDEVEEYAIDLAKKVFKVPSANVQPYSGSPANLAIISAITASGDLQLSQILSHGGHLSMGQEVSVTSRLTPAVYYHLTPDGEINWKELEDQALKFKPKIIWAGGTAYTHIFNWKKYAEIAGKIGAFFVADISHIAGLVAGGAHQSPVNYAHIVMTTTHKTLRGPRGAMIFTTQKGLDKDPDLAKKIDKAVFPGSQGGPHENTIAGIALALEEVQLPSFKKYAEQIVKNSGVLASEFIKNGYKLIGNGSKNHMIWIDLTNKNIEGWTAAWACEAAGIILNRQTIPFEPRSPYYPSGLRLGTPAVTTRGMQENEMIFIGKLINQVIQHVRKMDLKVFDDPDSEKRQEARRKFKAEIFKDTELQKINDEVRALCRKFPVYT